VKLKHPQREKQLESKYMMANQFNGCMIPAFDPPIAAAGRAQCP